MDQTLFRILEVISFYRGIVIDSVEQEFGREPNWRYLRARLLKALGDRGLEAKIKEVMKASAKVNCNAASY